MDIAIQYLDSTGKLLDPPKTLDKADECQLLISEIPRRLGSFHPIIHRSAVKEPDQVHEPQWFRWNPGWGYQPEDAELTESHHPALQEFIGPLPTGATLRKRAPMCFVAGIEFAKEFYSPLLGFPKVAAEGLLDMSKRFRRSFDAIASNPNIPWKAQERFGIGILVSQWAFLKRVGLPAPTWPEKVDAYQKMIRKKFTTATELESAEKRIKRWVKDAEERGGLFL